MSCLLSSTASLAPNSFLLLISFHSQMQYITNPIMNITTEEQT